MTQWYVKDLSKLAQVSVQTLHHYDRIALLSPSVRLANGYRLYSEKDLLKLQQIVALKFFGFELSQIKTLLATENNVVEHFSAQAQFLEEKAETLLEASKTLKSITSDCKDGKSIPWETIIKIIEVYRMTEQIEDKWVTKILSPKELKEYASFEQGLKTRFTESEKQACEEDWAALVKDVASNLDKDPSSVIGRAMGKRCMDWVNNLYGKEHVRLRQTIWEKGFKTGQVELEYGLSPKACVWLDQAIEAYYQNQIYSILAQVETEPQEAVLKQWKDLLVEMYGDEEDLKKDIFHAVMDDKKVSSAAKNWLKKT